MNPKPKPVITLAGLLLFLYIILFLLPNLCFGGFRIHYTIGLILLASVWVFSFNLVKQFSSKWKIVGISLIIIISFLIWVIIAAERKLHVLCW